MDKLQVLIHNIRCIKNAQFELPFDNGIYTFVGANGSGKSTLILCLAQLMMKQVENLTDGYNDDSFVHLQIGNLEQLCKRKNNHWVRTLNTLPKFNGLYEGSLFYGTRFEDSTIIEEKIAKNEILQSEISDADIYMKDRLSFILHGDTNHYRNLKRIKNRYIASSHNIKNLPYFNEVDGHLISQYRMSSGECLLISLMHFLYNSIVRRSLPVDQKALVLIDELELALHPIAVMRLMDYLKELSQNHSNLVVYLSTHSPEVIKTMRPKNLFRVNNQNGIVTLEQNCYPSYLIRDLYSNVSPDFLLLVEDELAQLVVNHILCDGSMRSNKLIHCIPVGGWQNVLDLHHELYSKKVLGNVTKIISILDGDIANQMSKQQKQLPHLLLPIPSVEKFLYAVIKDNSNPVLRRIINDKYFIVDSLDSVVSAYNNETLNGKRDNDKNFYEVLCKQLKQIGTSEEIFINGLCDEIIHSVDFSRFKQSLLAILNQS